MLNLKQVDIGTLQRVLYSLLIEQAPDIDASFVYKLNREQLDMIFDLLMTQDMGERQKKWKQIEVKAKSALSHMQSVFQRAKIFYLQLREKQQYQQDQKSLQDLESAF